MTSSSSSSSYAWSKAPSSQYPHYEASACILQVRGSPFGILVVDTNVTELLEFNTKRWWTVATLPTTKQGYATASLLSLQRRQQQQQHNNNNNNISSSSSSMVLAIGGFWKNRLALDTVHGFTFGSSAGEWHSLPSLLTPRCYPAAVSIVLEIDHNDHIDSKMDKNNKELLLSMVVVLGGRNATFQSLTSVEWYSNNCNNINEEEEEGQQQQQGNESNKWHFMPSFSIPRMAPAAVVLPCDSNSKNTTATTIGPRIVLIGGYTGSEWTTSLEVLEVTHDLLSMATTTTYTNDDQNYEDNSINSQEASWSLDTFPFMPFPVSFPQAVLIPSAAAATTPGIAAAAGTILVIGTSILQDMDDDTFTIIQSLNLNTKTWTVLLSTPKKKRRVPKEGSCIAFYKNTVYSIGGKEDEKEKEKQQLQLQKQQSQQQRQQQQQQIVMIQQQSQIHHQRGSKKVMHWKIDTSNPSLQLQKDGILDATSHPSASVAGGTTTSTAGAAATTTTTNRSVTSNRQVKSNVSSGVGAGGGFMDRSDRTGAGGTTVGSNRGAGGGGFLDQSDRSGGGASHTYGSYKGGVSGSGGGGGGGGGGNGSVGAGNSRNVPPAINVRSHDGSFGTDMESLYSNYNDHQSVQTAPSQMPTRSPQNDGEIMQTHREENWMYKDFHGYIGNYTGEVATATSRPHGKGQFRWQATGDVYDGEWKHGLRCGYGRMTYTMGDVFEGWFKNDMKEGRGTYQWRDGKQYEGLYVDDKAEDPNGSLTWKNGTLFVGNFTRGQRTGKGVIRFPSNVRYQGDFLRGKYDGFGTCTFQDGRVYTGQWRKGKAHGKGKLTESDGTVLHDGDWKNDEPILE